jgi:trans-aconitate methyltransferase
MRNPWLDIPLADYEAHMALPTVDQSELIAQQLARLVRNYSPRSVAVLGCAGGNGFDRLVESAVTRVVGVDINPAFVEETRRRYGDRIPGLELYVADVQEPGTRFDPVDLIYAGLILEYVDLPKTMDALRSWCRPDAVLAVLTQLPHESMAHVSPSPYHSLQSLDSGMRLVCDRDLRREASRVGFALMHSVTLVSNGGKQFRMHEFRLATPAA